MNQSSSGWNTLMKKYYISFQVTKDNEEFYHVFLNHGKFNEEDTVFISLFKLADEEFLIENNIDYIVDKDNNIIPIGIIDFQQQDKRCCEDVFRCIVTSKDELYKCNEIIDNIVKAIKIKYKSEKFIDMFNTSKHNSINLVKEIGLE